MIVVFSGTAIGNIFSRIPAASNRKDKASISLSEEASISLSEKAESPMIRKASISLSEEDGVRKASVTSYDSLRYEFLTLMKNKLKIGLKQVQT